MRSRGPLEATLVVLAATVLTIALTYPVAFRLDRTGRINTDDGRWSIWVVSWVAHALTTDPLKLYHANIFYPHRYALAFSEANIGAGALAAPVWAATRNPYTTHNVVFLLTFIIAFCGAYYLSLYLSGSKSAAAVAGVLFAFCPYMFARTAHVQLLFIGLLPFCMLAFHRLVDAPSIARSIVLGVLLWATALSCAYYGIFAGLMIGLGTFLFAYSRALWRSPDYWVAIALAAFISIGLTLPFFLPYIYVQDEMGFTRTLNDARQYSANFGAWGASAAWAHRWWLPALGRFNEVLFPGIMATIAGVAGAVIALRRTRDVAWLYMLIALLAFWSSFGPDAGLYRAFYEGLPIFSFLRAPSRMGVMVTMSLVALASIAIAQLGQRFGRPWLISGCLLVAGAAELARFPLEQFREVEPVSPIYRILATLPRGPVAEFPWWHQRSEYPRHAYYMLNSTAHWQPLVNGYSDHIPREFRETVLQLSSFPTRESFGILGRAGARYVVFHTDLYDPRLRARLVERLGTYSPYLRPLAKEGTVWLYEIVAWPN
ncbi:MAG TPA: hypothetical protein VNJ02_17070 [Vicinamibacterales bacterium]|nr:hypothetical protein [Vicinamibacterales bacterium]